jgi:CDGSH-type Zn-finger protein
MRKITIHKGKKYSICSCGLSKLLPFCDNKHRAYNQENKTNYNIGSSSNTTLQITRISNE